MHIFIKKYKYLLLIVIPLSVILIILSHFYIKIALLFITIFSPFIYLISVNIKSQKIYNLKILGVSFKDFMTIWVAFFGLLGIFGGVIQVQKQIQIQQKQLHDTRFSSSVELLGNQNESARIGGIYNLYFLAKEYPDEYLYPVCEIFCAHIRTITSDKIYQQKYEENASNEIIVILDFLFKKRENKLIFKNCYKDLRRVFLSGVYIHWAHLEHVNFGYATLNHVGFGYGAFQDVNFNDAILTHQYFIDIKMNKVYFDHSIFCWGYFEDSDLSDVRFKFCKFNNFDFKDTKLERIDFEGTVFKNYSYDEITKKGRSLELTRENN